MDEDNLSTCQSTAATLGDYSVNDYSDSDSYTESQFAALYSAYQIEENAVTDAGTADFNGDGEVDGVDFDIWWTNKTLSSGARRFNGDSDGDGDVDPTDFSAWDGQCAPSYVAADFNSSGAVDANDYAVWDWNDGAGPGATHAQGDADGDGLVSYRDFQIWNATVGLNYSPAGDYTGDCKVDALDWLVWQTNYMQWPNGGADKAHGDGNGDGHVDGLDFLVWQDWYPYPPVNHDDEQLLIGEDPLTPPLVDYDEDGVITPEEVATLFAGLDLEQ